MPGTNDAADTESTADLECLDACRAKGASEAECSVACLDWESQQENKPNSEGPKPDDRQIETGPDGQPVEGDRDPAPSDEDSRDGINGESPGEIDEAKEEYEAAVRAKSCIECWYDEEQNEGACRAESNACEESLACTQLQWCPSLCDQDNCIENCNDVIPTGVPILTALVQCMACNEGPCAESCADSDMLAYCD